jgi:hypothetical protein
MRKRLAIEIDPFAEGGDQIAASGPGGGDDGPLVGDRCQMDLQFRPLGLKPFLSQLITEAAPPVVVVMWKWFSPSRVVTPSSITMPSSPSISP